MRTGPGKKTIFFFFLLALVCVCIVELIVCRHYDPALYHSITDPVVSAATNTVTAVSNAAVNAATSLKEQINSVIREIEERRAAKELQKALEQARLEAEQSEPQAEPQDEIASPVSADDQTATEPMFVTSAAICDPAVTQLDEINGQDILTGGLVNVVYYNQGDELWGDLKYGSDKISTHGCGPTAMAIVVDSLSDETIDPYTMAQWAVSHGHWARHSGSYHSIVIGTATGFGLEAESFPSRDIVDLQDAILSGKLLVALMGPGHFTQSGHFIVLRGVTLSGEILVADPGSLERSLTAWDAQLIFDELSKSTSNGSPLWVISAPDSSVFE